jgi:hypothetical protein
MLYYISKVTTSNTMEQDEVVAMMYIALEWSWRHLGTWSGVGVCGDEGNNAVVALSLALSIFLV